MAMQDVVDESRNKVAEVDLNDHVFSCEIKRHLIHDAIRYQLAKVRRGTSSTKNRALVAGGGAKPWRQKGRGRARVGTVRSPLWRGGGVIFGPTPRSYSIAMPKKARKGALRSALSLKCAEGKLVVLDSLKIDEFKTKAFVEILKGLEIENALFVVDDLPITLERSARNIPGVKILRWTSLNVYDVLLYETIVLTKETLPEIEGRLSQ
ncbi:50S ribosomal protein L4 [Thermodesulfobacteriota bacterium]